MATQVFRTEPRSSLNGALVDHLQGRSRPTTARVRDDGASVVLLDAQGDPASEAWADQMLRDARAWAAACERRRREKAKRKGGRPPKLFRDAFFAGPRTSDRAVAMKFAKDCVQWINDVYGRGSRMATASVHLDEAVLHVHASHAVADPEGLPGWSAVERSSRVGAGRLKGRDFLSALQDDFHSEVGQRYGLGRGEVGGKARHEPIDRAKSEGSRIEVLERDLASARFEAGELRGLLRRAFASQSEWHARYELASAEAWTSTQERNEARSKALAWKKGQKHYRRRAEAAEKRLEARPASRPAEKRRAAPERSAAPGR